METPGWARFPSWFGNPYDSTEYGEWCGGLVSQLSGGKEGTEAGGETAGADIFISSLSDC